MEFTKIEVTEVEQLINEVFEKDVRELADLQLAFVGGGIGDVIVA